MWILKVVAGRRLLEKIRYIKLEIQFLINYLPSFFWIYWVEIYVGILFSSMCS